MSFTAKLRKAQQDGCLIVCSVAPYEGREVVYDPGYARCHPSPWIVPGTGLRYSGRECHALPPDEREGSG